MNHINNIYDDTENREEEVCREAFRILSAVRSPDVSMDAEKNKEAIFGQVKNKIGHQPSFYRISKRTYLLSAVAVFVVLIMSNVFTYQFLHKATLISPEVAQIEISAPSGAQSDIILPDGSLVTLNANSRLKYASVFTSGRTVYLEGEGYFDVAKDPEHPFIIQTKEMEVEVLGTRFGVQAYPNEELTVVTVEEGSVEASMKREESLGKFILTADQQLSFNKETGEFLRKNVSAVQYTSWRNGHFIFRDVSMESIARELERRFQVEIEFHDYTLKSEKYYVTFEHNENLDEMLRLLSYKRKWDYKITGQKVDIYKMN